MCAMPAASTDSQLVGVIPQVLRRNLRPIRVVVCLQFSASGRRGLKDSSVCPDAVFQVDP